MTAYRAAKAQGARTVVIESGQYGTTCARVGCMPSKLLIAAAEASHVIDTSAPFGVHASDKRIDGRAVMDRVKRERDRFVGFVLEGVEAMPVQDRLQGRARFTGPCTLVVDEHTEIQAGRIVIATGSTPLRLPQLENVGPGIVTSDDVFYWDDLPRSVAVIGTGVIGLELGQALARLDEAMPDVLICDLVLPEMDGIEFLQAAASRGYAGKVILLSALEDGVREAAEELARALGLRVVGSFRKPLTPEQLRQALEC